MLREQTKQNGKTKMPKSRKQAEDIEICLSDASSDQASQNTLPNFNGPACSHSLRGNLIYSQSKVFGTKAHSTSDAVKLMQACSPKDMPLLCQLDKRKLIS